MYFMVITCLVFVVPFYMPLEPSEEEMSPDNIKPKSTNSATIFDNIENAHNKNSYLNLLPPSPHELKLAQTHSSSKPVKPAGIRHSPNTKKKPLVFKLSS